MDGSPCTNYAQLTDIGISLFPYEDSNCTQACDLADLVDVAHCDGGEEDLGERRGRRVDGRHDSRLAELLARLVHEHRRHQDRRRHDLKQKERKEAWISIRVRKWVSFSSFKAVFKGIH